jgi:acetyl esterase/lipase
LLSSLAGPATTFGRSPNTSDETAALIGKALSGQRADDDMMGVLAAYVALAPRPVEKTDPLTARKNPTFADAVNTVLRQRARSTDPESRVLGVKSRDTSIGGAEGELSARIYSPIGAGPYPVVVYFHGGGWVLGDKNAYDDGARGLSYYAKAVVVSVDYRLAPENRFPAAWDDALAAYRWVLQHAAEIQGDPQRVALAGENSGGTLALATAIAARDAGLPKPAHILAIYPITQTSLSTPSYVENATAPPVSRATMQWVFDKVARTPDDLRDPRLQLIDANLSQLPPVTVITARIDPLRCDGEKLVEALRRAGVPVEHRDFEGTTHEFFGTAAVVEKAERAQAYAGQRLSSAFATQAATYTLAGAAR